MTDSEFFKFAVGDRVRLAGVILPGETGTVVGRHRSPKGAFYSVRLDREKLFDDDWYAPGWELERV